MPQTSILSGSTFDLRTWLGLELYQALHVDFYNNYTVCFYKSYITSSDTHTDLNILHSSAQCLSNPTDIPKKTPLPSRSSVPMDVNAAFPRQRSYNLESLPPKKKERTRRERKLNKRETSMMGFTSVYFSWARKNKTGHFPEKQTKVHSHKQTMMRLFEFWTFYYSFLLLMDFFLKEAVHQRAFCSYSFFFCFYRGKYCTTLFFLSFFFLPFLKQYLEEQHLHASVAPSLSSELRGSRWACRLLGSYVSAQYHPEGSDRFVI